jgi:two-component system sensor histidine kinase UhpB
MTDDINLKEKTSPTILVVEDNAPDRALVNRKIRELWPDCNIESASSLSAAYKALHLQDFDMVVLDLNLPDTMGPNTVSEIRKLDSSIPIIVLTGMLSSITADESLRLGANNIYSKAQLMDDDFLNVLEQNAAT